SAEPRGLPRAGLRPGRGDAGGGGGGGAGTVSPPKERLCWEASRLPGSGHRRKRERLGKSAAAAQGPWGQPREEAMGAHRADLAVPRRARVGCTVARGADFPCWRPGSQPTASKGAGLEVGFREKEEGGAQ
ncbi:hypothetical protein H1C71_018980, partial [Ictidomys tridecemlineatus]